MTPYDHHVLSEDLQTAVNGVLHIVARLEANKMYIKQDFMEDVMTELKDFAMDMREEFDLEMHIGRVNPYRALEKFLIDRAGAISERR